MRFLLLSLLFPLIGFAQESEFIRVRMASAQKEISLGGIGIRFSGQSQFQKIAIPRNRLYQITAAEKGFEIVDGPYRQTINTPYLMLQGNSLVLNGKQTPDRVILSRNQNKMDVVAMLPLESYLLGVVASEVPSNWPIETLKAQAIVARTYAMAAMRERHNRFFHVESTVLDQVFRHIGETDARHRLIRAVVEAVESTKGQYLADKLNLPIKAYFHADCGGVTADAKEVWGVKGTEVVVDKACELAESTKWNYYISRKEISEKLQSHFKLLPSQILQKIELIKGSSRVAAIRFIFSVGDSKQMTSDQLRSLFGYNLMKSAMFQVQETSNGFSFEGRGHGHGVGLCQWGSRKLGLKGKNHQEILNHYYPKAKLQESTTAFSEFRTAQSLLVQTK